MVDAVDGFGAGDFLKDLGDLGQAFFQCLTGVGVVLQVGQRFADDGVPQVPFGLTQLGRVSGLDWCPLPDLSAVERVGADGPLGRDRLRFILPARCRWVWSGFCVDRNGVGAGGKRKDRSTVHQR